MNQENNLTVKIYQPSKTATQSGKKDSSWLLVPIITNKHQSIDAVLGWTSSNNTLAQLKLKFHSAQEAAQYAKNQGWNYKIINPKISQIPKKSYSDNFTN